MTLTKTQRSALIASLSPEEQRALFRLIDFCVLNDDIVNDFPDLIGQLFDSLAGYHGIWTELPCMRQTGFDQEHEIANIRVRSEG
jgi:hypothetical protein